MDLTRLGSLEFEKPDVAAFPSLEMAITAGRTGGTAPAILNAANEVAVAAFLDGTCAFTDIDRTVAETLMSMDVEPATSVEHVEAADAEARRVARGLLGREGRKA